MGKYYDDDIELEFRTLDEIGEYEEEAFDRVWLVRHWNLAHAIVNGIDVCEDEIWDRALKAAGRICKQYGIDPSTSVSDWEYGYWSGILAALRWVTGDEKDFLDT